MRLVFFLSFILPGFCFLRTLWSYVPSRISLSWDSDSERTLAPPPKRECYIRRNFNTNMLRKFDEHIIGQHIARLYAFPALLSHFSAPEPRHALTMILSGSTGVGKNFLSTLIAEAIFEDDARYFVHLYSGRTDFPDPERRSQYRQKLRDDIEKYVAECERSIFIFDEIDKMPEGIIDVIKPYIDFYSYYKEINFRKATFIFLTNIGGREINTYYKSQMDKGIVRESIEYSNLEPILRVALFENNGMFGGSDIIENHMISHFLPFLPLQKKHVKDCIISEMRKQDIPVSMKESVVNNVLKKTMFYMDDYSVSGCKRVGDHVNVEKFKRANFKPIPHKEL